MNADPKEFSAALARGSGRAMILLRQARGDGSFKDALVRACICNQAYDPQCEEERRAYLARLIAATGHRDLCFAELAPSLSAAADDDTDIPQVFAVLARLAAQGGEPDKSLIRSAYSGLSQEDQLDCMEAIVRLDGLPAFIQCLNRVSANVPDEWWRVAGLLEALQERDGPEIEPPLQLARSEHPALDQAFAQIETERLSQLAPADEPYDFPSIRAALQRGEQPSGWSRRFAEDELRLLAKDLRSLSDEIRARPYLRRFARRDFPGDPQELIRWAESSTPRTAAMAVRALSRCKSPIVRAMARTRLERGDLSGAWLLASNYIDGNFGYLDPLMRAAMDDDEAHDFGFALLKIFDHSVVPIAESEAMLLWLYERTPCSICRSTAASKLVELGRAPTWMAEEAPFDADPSTVQLFNTELAA